MAKQVSKTSPDLIVDRTLLVGLLCASTSYIVRGTWASMFFGAGAIVIGIIWSYRAATTHPDREFRLLATLLIVLIWCLISFYLASAMGLL
jgi:hypothetical protein